MVAIVSGDSLGLSLSSHSTLGTSGAPGAFGNAALGSNGERAYVNIATGNLVLQTQDEFLASVGADVVSLRTYNSQGALAGQDSWAVGVGRQRISLLAGTRGGAGSRVARLDADGALATYTWDTSRAVYVTSEGAGADDTVGLRADGGFDWSDGATRTVETYDKAGQLLGIVDTGASAGSGKKVTSYLYDLAGNRVREKTTQENTAGVAITHQDNTIAYDALGRLHWVADGRAHVKIGYDAVGNRSSIETHVINGDTRNDQVRYFQYDVMNRQVVADAIDGAGTLGSSGHRIAYDRNGNKISDTWIGNVVSKLAAQQLVARDSESGREYSTQLGDRYEVAAGLTTERYSYDALGRVSRIVRDGVKVDERYYDAAGHLVQSGMSTLDNAYLQALNGVNNQGAVLEGNGVELTKTRYDAAGHILEQQNSSGGNVTSEIFYREMSASRPDRFEGRLMVDNAGNVTDYYVRSGMGLYKYSSESVYREGRMVTQTDVENIGGNRNGWNVQTYDANGNLNGVDDKIDSRDRSFVTDAAGRVLAVNQGGHIQRQLVVNGEVLGRYGEAVDDRIVRKPEQTPAFKNVADFGFGFEARGGNTPARPDRTHVVAAGDTMQALAQSYWGDSRLWYRIAEANGITSNADLVAGQVLKIPGTESSSNAANTFKPYDPSEIVGDTSPAIPSPKKKKTNWFAAILAVVVAVVLTVVTGGMAGAALGSIASQAINIAAGNQKGFSWKQVALSAISAGVGAGLKELGLAVNTSNATVNVVANAAIANTVTQGIAVVTGLQDRFSWSSVAASAVGAGVGQVVGSAMALNDPNFGKLSFGEQFGRRLATGLIAGAATAVARGGKVAIQQVAVDAFGNALGYSLAENANSAPATQGNGPSSGSDHVNGMDLQSDQAYERSGRNALYGWSTGNDGQGFKPLAGVSSDGLRYQDLRALNPLSRLMTVNEPATMLDFDPDGKWAPNTPDPISDFAKPTSVAFLPVGLLNPVGATGAGGAVGGGYKPVRPLEAGSPPPYDIVRDVPSGAPASMLPSPSLGLGAPPQQISDKPWFDRAIDGIPLPVRAIIGLNSLITTKISETLGITTPSRGGTYVLRDEEGNVVRSGRTNDLERRQREHFRDPALSDYTFEPQHRTDEYREQRGLEHRLHETYNPPLNKIRPINPSNPRMPDYLDAAGEYLRRQGK